MKSISGTHRALIGLFVMSLITGIFFTNCAKNGFTASNPEQYGEGADPFLAMAWHINNTAQKVFALDAGVAGVDLNLLKTWQSEIFGDGIKILISDDGVENTHEDLQANHLKTAVSKDYSIPSYSITSAAPIASDDNHGTAVAGLIAAVASNGVGTKGVAPKSSIGSANFLSSTVKQMESFLVDQAGGDFDIFNMSWGSTQNSLIAAVPAFHAKMRTGVLNLRSGKGAIYVKSAGNDYSVYCRGSKSTYCVGNSNFDSDNTTPYTIMTAALNASGYAASYSSMGSNLWISSFGGEFGDDSPAMITTDRMGCSKGFSNSSVGGSLVFERGGLGNTGCNYSATFNGTSAAAPVLSGAIALILQANPSLTWRDVKYILAKTAVPIDYTTSGALTHPEGEAIPTGAIWERVWIENSAGFKFHNWYGFGRIDVDAAVALAKDYHFVFGNYIETNWADERSGLNLAIPDNSATGVSDVMAIGTNVKIESVQLKVWITHTNVANLSLELTSPSGTKNILINMNNSLSGLANYQGEVFLSNAFYQEGSQGAWTLKVVDGKESHTGTLTRWSLSFTGSD